jgi:3-phenylpropionate/trans-cinnamate dioxygenase ferredoxin component
MSYTKIADLAELESETPKRVKVNGDAVVLVKIQDEVFAVSGTCTHENAQLSGGFIEDCSIECPRHGAQFDLKTGEALTLPAVKPLNTYPIRIEGSAVLIGID